MGPTIPESFFIDKFTPCECCRIKYTASTFTVHKWTEEEIKSEILQISIELSKKKWYESKSYLKNKLKHWCGKLEKLQEVRSEIEL